MRDPYRVLGVERGASPAALKQAYRRLAREWHPDRNPAPEAEARFKEVAAAWEILGDPEKRRRYELQHGRASRGELPEEFLADVGDAIDRAERWIRTGILPHYARFWRGLGAEMAARLIADLEDLVVPRDLAPAGWWKRRQVRRATDSIVVTALLGYEGEASALIRGRGFVEIAILPLPLWRAGFRDPAELDTAIMRLLLTRFAQVLAARGVRGYGREATEMIARSRQVDSHYLFQRTARRLGWSVLAGLVGFMLLSGYYGW